MERTEKGTFAKGNSGGPGRPKKEREEKYYDITLNSVPFEQWKKIVIRAARQAENGDATARKWLADYLQGAPIQRTELSGPEGGSIQVEYVNNPYPTTDVPSEPSGDTSEPK